MDNDLRVQIATLRSELATTQSRIADLRRRHVTRRHSGFGGVIACSLVGVLAFAFVGFGQLQHKPGSKLPVQKTYPPPRIVVTAKGSYASAPFVVADANGEPFFIVKEGSKKPDKNEVAPADWDMVNAPVPRGAYVLNAAGDPVAALQAIDDAGGGGAIRVMASGRPETRVTLAATKEDDTLTVRDGRVLVYASGNAELGGMIAVFGAHRVVASLEVKDGLRPFAGVSDDNTGNLLAYMIESQIGTGEIAGVDASTKLFGWYFIGGPHGACGCVERKEHEFCMGDRVVVE